MNNDIIKRIKFLETQLLDKKQTIEKDLRSIETICKELISLKEKVEKDSE